MTQEQLLRKYRNARSEAKRRGIEFSLTREEYASIFDNMRCAISGRSLHVGHKSDELCASVDRIDNAAGYVLSNVQLVSLRLNRIKSDATIHDVELILQHMKKEKKCPPGNSSETLTAISLA